MGLQFQRPQIRSALALLCLGLAMLANAACTKAKPDIKGQTLDAIVFVNSPKITINNFATNSFTASCPKDVTKVELSLDQLTWVDVSLIDSSAQVNCVSNGQFSFNADFNQSWASGLLTALKAHQTVTIYARGQSELQFTDIGTLLVAYSPGIWGPPAAQLVGATKDNTSTSFKLAGQAHFMAGPGPSGSTTEMVSTNFRVRGMVRSR